MKACFSSLLHDLSVAKSCLGFNAKTVYNPVSVHFSSELQEVYRLVVDLYRKVDELASLPLVLTFGMTLVDLSDLHRYDFKKN